MLHSILSGHFHVFRGRKLVMRIATNLADLKHATKPIVLAAGAFDGVHRGHRAVIETAIADAKQRGGEAWALTFDPHPLRILQPASAPPMLTSASHKSMLLAQTGLDGCIVHPFTRDLASLEPEAFIDFLRDCIPNHAALVVGFNFNFGRRARGDTKMLRDLGTAGGFDVHVVEGLQWNGDGISSTRIRQAVTDGKLDDAAAMLGRPFSIFGRVVKGKQLGRQLGFPTANVLPDNEVRPPPGSYAVRARIASHPQHLYAAAGYVGHRDRGFGPEIEVHLLDHDLDLYGVEMDVSFIRLVRADAHFDTLDALKTAIARDVASARNLLASL